MQQHIYYIRYSDILPIAPNSQRINVFTEGLYCIIS